MKHVGILGGLGPETTAQFYLNIMKKVEFELKVYPPMAIYNVPVNLEKEKSFINGKNESEYYIKLLTQGIHILEQMSANFIAIPCNSVHIILNSLKKETSLPILSIVEETVNFLVKLNIHKVSLLATGITIKSKLYAEKLEQTGIKCIQPNRQNQNRLNEVIVKILNNEHTHEDEFFIHTIINLMIKESDAVLLACTDLQLITPIVKEIPIYDTMEILAQSTVRYLLDES